MPDITTGITRSFSSLAVGALFKFVPDPGFGVYRKVTWRHYRCANGAGNAHIISDLETRVCPEESPFLLGG